MKKIFSILLLFVVFFSSAFLIYKIILFDNFDKKYNNTTYVSDDSNEFRSVFISYLDYSILKGKSLSEQKDIIDEMIDTVKDYKLNNIILQVRGFADSIYNSNIFLSSSKVVSNEGDELVLDILSYFITKAHENNITLYAWINPYRIRNSGNTNNISSKNVFSSWFGTDKIIYNDEGIFFNPSSGEVLDLILSGVEEIINNYDVDGILYDDYFYPDTNIDLDNYNDYISKNSHISLNEYRIMVINNLISGTNNLIKNNNSKILFGISPSGNLENNLNYEYLDVSYVVNNNLVDFIIPQIYYGFLNQNKPFTNTYDEWKTLVGNSIKMYAGLALYKAGNIDNNALSGSNEWIDYSDIIKRQIAYQRNVGGYGYALFRYSYLVDYYNSNLDNELSNILTLN